MGVRSLSFIFFHTDPSYDSEEERRLEHLEAIHRRRKQRNDAASQMEMLRRYREEQEAARRVSFEALRANISIGSNTETLERTGSITRQVRGQDLAIIAKHEEAWTRLEQIANTNDNLETLRYDDIPWPPFGADLGRYLMALANFLRGNGQSVTTRRAFAQAQLRFHPDKFRHRHSHRVSEADRERIMAEMHRVSQGLNEAREKMQAP